MAQKAKHIINITSFFINLVQIDLLKFISSTFCNIFQCQVQFVVEIMLRVLTFSLMPSWAGWAITALVRWSNKTTSDLSEKYRKQGHMFIIGHFYMTRNTMHQCYLHLNFNSFWKGMNSLIFRSLRVWTKPRHIRLIDETFKIALQHVS